MINRSTECVLTQLTGVLIRRGNLATNTRSHRGKATWGHRKKAVIWQAKEAWGETTRADSLILAFWPLELRENRFLLFKPPSLQCFVWQPGQTKTHILKLVQQKPILLSTYRTITPTFLTQHFAHSFWYLMSGLGTPLVAQWLRICLARQGTWFRFLVGELGSHKLRGS